MEKNSKTIEISNIVNSTLFNPIEVGVQLSNDHRYLVNEMFKMFLHFSGKLSMDYEKGYYDGRNEFACKCAKIIVDALKENDMYDIKFWANKYQEILNK
jgi:hypothetical protein